MLARKLVVGTVSALTLTTIAYAQEEPAATPHASALEEIIVTAQRREENLQTVPVAVTAIAGDELKKAGTATVNDLNQLVPGLNIQNRGNDTQPTIRGVGNAARSLGNEPNVAVYVDGAYQPLSSGSLFRFADIAQIEVLRGPQGTLFGRNATGGLLNFITRKPATDRMHADVSAAYSRFNSLDFDGYVSGPVGSKVAMSASGYYSNSDGYLSNPNKPGEHVAETRAAGFRAKVLYTPTDRVEATLSADYTYNDDPTPVMPTIAASSSPFLNPALPLVRLPAPFIQTTDTPYVTTSNFGESKFDQFGATANVKVGFDSFDLISITSYRKSKYEALNDGDISPFHAVKLTFDDDTKTFNEDVRIQSSTDSRFQWLLGAFGIYNEEAYEPFDFQTSAVPTAPAYGPLFLLSKASVETEAYAVYGQASFDITDQLTVIGGLRYSDEKKKLFAAGTALGVVPIPTQRESTTFDNLSPKVTLQYQFNPSNMVYVTYGEAFKSGTYNPLQILDAGSPQDATNEVEPEEIKSYEAGWKADVTDNLRVNVAGFYYDYKNIQTTINEGAINKLENAAKATVKGAEVEVFSSFSGLLTADDTLSLTGNVAWLDAKYDSYPNASVSIYPGPYRGVFNVTADVSGNTMIRSPEWTGAVGLNYRTRQDWGTVAVSTNAYFSASFFYDEGNTALYGQPSFEKVNASLGYTTPDDVYTIELWGKNLTDATTFMHTYLQTNLAVAKAWYPPRTYGVTFRAKF